MDYVGDDYIAKPEGSNYDILEYDLWEKLPTISQQRGGHNRYSYLYWITQETFDKIVEDYKDNIRGINLERGAGSAFYVEKINGKIKDLSELDLGPKYTYL